MTSLPSSTSSKTGTTPTTATTLPTTRRKNYQRQDSNRSNSSSTNRRSGGISGGGSARSVLSSASSSSSANKSNKTTSTPDNNNNNNTTSQQQQQQRSRSITNTTTAATKRTTSSDTNKISNNTTTTKTVPPSCCSPPASPTRTTSRISTRTTTTHIRPSTPSSSSSLPSPSSITRRKTKDRVAATAVLQQQQQQQQQRPPSSITTTATRKKGQPITSSSPLSSSSSLSPSSNSFTYPSPLPPNTTSNNNNNKTTTTMTTQQQKMMTNSRNNSSCSTTTTTSTTISNNNSTMSVNKTLTELLLMPSNRSCCDCKSTLVDVSKICISLSIPPPPAPRSSSRKTKTTTTAKNGNSDSSSNNNSNNNNNNKTTNRIMASFAVDNFRKTHMAFSPPQHAKAVTATNSNNNPLRDDDKEDDEEEEDPSQRLSRYVGFGVFVCSSCGKAHELLGNTITIVRPVFTSSSNSNGNASSSSSSNVWTIDDVQRLSTLGGNAMANTLLEAHVPKLWNAYRRPKHDSSLSDRLIFVRAKYHAMAFMFPYHNKSSSSSKRDHNNNNNNNNNNKKNVISNDAWKQIIDHRRHRIINGVGGIEVSINNNINDNDGTAKTTTTEDKEVRDDNNNSNNNNSSNIDNDDQTQQQQEQEHSRRRRQQQKSHPYYNDDMKHLNHLELTDQTALSVDVHHNTDESMLLKDMLGQQPATSTAPNSSTSELPNRLVDYFCVVTASDALDPTMLTSRRTDHDISRSISPESIKLVPQLVDCYPSKDAYENNDDGDNTQFPEHVASLVYPDGCRPSSTAHAPSFFTMVLTGATGDRLYGAALRIYDHSSDVHHLRYIIQSSGYNGKLPSWLLDEDDDDDPYDQDDDDDEEEDLDGSQSESLSLKSWPLRSPTSNSRKSSQNPANGRRSSKITGNPATTSSTPKKTTITPQSPRRSPASAADTASTRSTPNRRSVTRRQKQQHQHQHASAMSSAVSITSDRTSVDGSGNNHKLTSDVVFLPKTIIILSHYPFFDIWRKFLLRIYRISLTEAPLPIERFISNFVSEIPLPPPGQIQIKFGFTINDSWYIERPPDNELPICNFSYRPLFASLSVNNVMVVIGCLLQECRVVLLSRHTAMLTPCCEALLSLLFPFHWQGMYLPIMPYIMSIDMLEAPVPFLVGLHSRYLSEVSPQRRPTGVVFVDLDRDVVHLGQEDDVHHNNNHFDHHTDLDHSTRSASAASTSAMITNARTTPGLPEKEALKLKSRLAEQTSTVYIMPASSKVGSITTLDERQLPYSRRDTYAHVNGSEYKDSTNNGSNGHHNASSPSSSSMRRRKDVFKRIDKAYPDAELQVPITGFLSDHGQLYERVVDTTTNGGNKSSSTTTPLSTQRASTSSSTSSPANGSGSRTNNKFNFLQRKRNGDYNDASNINGHSDSSSSPRRRSSRGQGGSDNDPYDNLLDLDEPPGFDSMKIRHAFLKFFVTMLRDYRQYMDENNNNNSNNNNNNNGGGVQQSSSSSSNSLSFRTTEFVTSMNLSNHHTNIFMYRVLQTQMFALFLQERRENPTDPEVLYFDESITLKHNRSKKATLTGRKKETIFLNDKSNMVTTTYSPPPPSNWGLPDDGRSYQYGSFPKLDPQLFGKIRKPREWPKDDNRTSTISLRAQSRRGTTSTASLFAAARAREQAVAVNVSKTVMEPAAIRARGLLQRGGVRNLETALGALSSQYTNTSTTTPNGTSSPRRGNNNNNNSDNDVVGGTSTSSNGGQEMDAGWISIATDVVLNARRKQGILIDIIIKIQSLCRKYFARKIYELLKTEAIDLESDSRAAREASEKAAAERLRKKKNSASVLIQTWTKYRLYLRAVIRIQSVARRRRVISSYRLLLGAVIRVQAMIRAIITRARLSRLCEGRMRRYKKLLPMFWRRSHTPLSYRTKFWPLVSSCSSPSSSASIKTKETAVNALHVAIAETELRRLWDDLGVVPSKLLYTGELHKNGEVNGRGGGRGTEHIDRQDKNIPLGMKLGVSNETYWTALKVEARLASKKENSSSRIAALRKAADRETSERMEIYHRLSDSSGHGVMKKCIEVFSLGHKDKLKKVAIAESLWRDDELVDESCSLMNDIFPELSNSTDIVFTSPSKKALKRFRHLETYDKSPKSLPKDMWAHMFLEQRIRKDVAEVADDFLRQVPVLMNRFSNLASRQQLQGDHDRKTRMKLMRWLLFPTGPRHSLTTSSRIGSVVDPQPSS